MMRSKLLAALVSAVGVVSFALTGLASAQDYPNRLIKIVHGFPPGGNIDLIARLVAEELQRSLAQTVVVEAKPGQAGALAADTVARSEPDGYTLLIVASAHPAHGGLSKNVRYKVVEDFQWISTASFYPFLIAVRKDSRLQSLGQLLEEARQKPGDLKYGSAGIGSILHTTVELLANDTKTKFLHVPYRGELPAITGLLTGDFDFIAATTGPITARVKAGEVRALAVTGKARWRDLPDVPTVAESGVPNFEVVSWTGLAGPAGLPKPVVDRLNGEMRKIVAKPEIASKLQAMGGDPRALSPDEMRALVQSQFETWRRLGQATGLSID